MSSKRKWDQAAPSDTDTPAKAPKIDEGKTASEAAAAAAAAGGDPEDTVMMEESDDEDDEAKERRRRDEEERQKEIERARAIQASSLDVGGPMKIRTDYVPKCECFLIPCQPMRSVY